MATSSRWAHLGIVVVALGVLAGACGETDDDVGEASSTPTESQENDPNPGGDAGEEPEALPSEFEFDIGGIGPGDIPEEVGTCIGDLLFTIVQTDAFQAALAEVPASGSDQDQLLEALAVVGVEEEFFEGTLECGIARTQAFVSQSAASISQVLPLVTASEALCAVETAIEDLGPETYARTTRALDITGERLPEPSAAGYVDALLDCWSDTSLAGFLAGRDPTADEVTCLAKLRGDTVMSFAFRGFLVLLTATPIDAPIDPSEDDFVVIDALTACGLI